MAVVIQRTINANIPYVPWLTGYLAILVGASATFLMQSSSVFTSALTPLVGMGVISVNRMYPLCLGSNIGTTTTAILAALTASAKMIKYTMQIALCHFFFNITGILIFYPLPFMRWPLPMCKRLGKITAQYRWFAFAYLLLAFLIIPALVLGLSLADANGIVLISVLGVVIVITVVAGIINLMQNKWPKVLPEWLRTWNFLPLFMHSLEPYDRLISKVCKCCVPSIEEDVEELSEVKPDKEEGEEHKDHDDEKPKELLGVDNKAFDLQ
jgi:solute carrier family 34 (sodium-dependent phosphate cotransporter)